MNPILQRFRNGMDFVLQSCRGGETTQNNLLDSSGVWKSSVFYSILSPFEAHLVSLQSLLIWEKPFLSAAAFVTVNILYWMIVSWSRKFISIISLFAMAIFLLRALGQVWTEIRVPPEEDEDTEKWTPLNPEVLSVPELSHYGKDIMEKITEFWKYIWKLRKDNKGLFCTLMCGFFCVTGLIGRMFPGVIIMYTVVLAFTLGPGIALHLVPRTFYDQLIGFFAEVDNKEASPAVAQPVSSRANLQLEDMMQTLSGGLAMKENVPSPGRVLNESDFDLQGAVMDDSSLNESELSFCQGIGSIPSVEEVNESDEDSLAEFMPRGTPDPHLSFPMHFNPSHFKEGSSESESDNSNGTPSLDKMFSPMSTVTEQKTPASDLEDELADFEVLEESDIHT